MLRTGRIHLESLPCAAKIFALNPPCTGAPGPLVHSQVDIRRLLHDIAGSTLRVLYYLHSGDGQHQAVHHRTTQAQGNDKKSAVARPQERKFFGFSFTDGPVIRRRIAPKAVEGFKAYTKAWTANLKVHLMPDTELLEMICENEKERGRLIGK